MAFGSQPFGGSPSLDIPAGPLPSTLPLDSHTTDNVLDAHAPNLALGAHQTNLTLND